MKVKLKRISPLPAAKLAAVLYACLSIIIVPLTLLISIAGALAEGEDTTGVAEMGLFMLIIMPIFYAVIGFIGTLIGCFTYNLVANWIGGVELEFDQNELEIQSRSEAF